jgi:hypothetical protein
MSEQISNMSFFQPETEMLSFGRGWHVHGFPIDEFGFLLAYRWTPAIPHLERERANRADPKIDQQPLSLFVLAQLKIIEEVLNTSHLDGFGMDAQTFKETIERLKLAAVIKGSFQEDSETSEDAKKNVCVLPKKETNESDSDW